jgi:nitrite reductase (NADH) large subunit
VVLISQDPQLPYYRLNLTRYLAGEVTESELPLHPAGWYDEQNVQLKRGVSVRSIDAHAKTVALSDGSSESFDKLVLTVGADPFVPPIAGADKQNVTTVRTLDDAQQLLALVGDGATCVCIGGGILGLETAGALKQRGAAVSLLEGDAWLMPRQLNADAARLLADYVTDRGIKLYPESTVQQITGDRQARGVRLADGTELPADVVIITTGIRSNLTLAKQAGLTTNMGVVVDDHLLSSHPDILAAGDVAEHRETVYGLWAPAQFQGSIAGMNAAGGQAEFGGIPPSNILKVLGIDLFSIGQFGPDGDADVIDQESDGKYFRFVFRDGRLIGAILLGDMSASQPVTKAVEGATDLSELLASKPSAFEVARHFAENAS